MLTYANFRREAERESQLARVIRAVRGELRLREVGPQLGRLSGQAGGPSPFVVPFIRNPDFVGREEDEGTESSLSAIISLSGSVIQKGGQFPDVNGMERLEMLFARTEIALQEEHLAAEQRQRLAQADQMLLEQARRFYIALIHSGHRLRRP